MMRHTLSVGLLLWLFAMSTVIRGVEGTEFGNGATAEHAPSREIMQRPDQSPDATPVREKGEEVGGQAGSNRDDAVPPGEVF